MKKEIKQARKFLVKNPSRNDYVNKNYSNFWNWTFDQPDDDSIEIGKEWDEMYRVAFGKEPEDF